MTQRGAKGTDEELTRVTRFFLANLTLVNVNSSPADELKWVLGVRDDVIRRFWRGASVSRFGVWRSCGQWRVYGRVIEERKGRISF